MTEDRHLKENKAEAKRMNRDAYPELSKERLAIKDKKGKNLYKKKGNDIVPSDNEDMTYPNFP